MRAVDIIKEFEGLSLVPYRCPAGVPTIGWGATRYQDGRKVTMNDQPITEMQAEALLQYHLNYFRSAVNALTTDDINSNQYEALTSFVYNIGETAYRNSTILKLINMNPNDPDIKKQFFRWVYVDGKPSRGLRRRRTMESELYFS